MSQKRARKPEEQEVCREIGHSITGKLQLSKLSNIAAGVEHGQFQQQLTCRPGGNDRTRQRVHKNTPGSRSNTGGLMGMNTEAASGRGKKEENGGRVIGPTARVQRDMRQEQHYCLLDS